MKALFSIVQVKNNHWIAIFVSIQEGIIAIIDPTSDNPSIQSTVLENANKYLNHFNLRPFTNIQKSYPSRQSTQVDSSVFCCFYIKQFIANIILNNSIKNTNLNMTLTPLEYRIMIQARIIYKC